MRACSLTAYEMRRVIETLEGEERVKRVTEGNTVSYWPLGDEGDDGTEVSVVSAPVSGTGTDTFRPHFQRVK